METTIDRPTADTPELSRSRYRRGADVVAAVEELAAVGMKRHEITALLGMTYHGLRRALQRAGRRDLVRAIAPPRGTPSSTLSVEATRQRAAELLDSLPDEDLNDAIGRRKALLAEACPDMDEARQAPRGRQVRGPGGVVRWVAA